MASLVDGYESALQAFPLATKCVTSLVGFTVADVVAQTLLAGPLRRRPDADDDHLRFDPRRTLANGVFGLAFYGPVSSAWYAALDANVLPDAPSSAVAVAAKTALDQIVWAPVLVASLFAWDLVRAGEPLAPRPRPETATPPNTSSFPPTVSPANSPAIFSPPFWSTGPSGRCSTC